MKSLVIYYSHTGENYTSSGLKNLTKGNTEVVAEKIAKEVNADLFRVETVKQYPYGYYDCCDEAKMELQSNARPTLKKDLTDISGYDVIFVGGPVWWSHLPMGMFSALENLDFSNKIVMPFTTHEGSGLGDVLSDVKTLCKNATIKNGLSIYGSKVSNSDSLIKNWIASELK